MQNHSEICWTTKAGRSKGLKLATTCGKCTFWTLLFPVYFLVRTVLKKNKECVMRKKSMILKNRALMKLPKHVSLIFFFLSHQQPSSLCHKLLTLFTLHQQRLVRDCKNCDGVKASSVLYKLCVQCMFNHMKPNAGEQTLA